MKRYVLLLLISLPFLSGAQPLPGQIKLLITDKASKEPIPFCTVLLYAEELLIDNAVSDFDGKALFAPVDPGTYSIKISSMGYEDLMIKKIVVSGGQTVVYKAEMSTSEQVLESIEIVTHKRKAKFKRNKQNIAALTPGIQVQDKGELRIRGARSGNNQVFIDGVKIRDGDYDGVPESITGTHKPQKTKRKRNEYPDPQRVYSYRSQQYGYYNEEYIPIEENEFEASHANPLSTFSIDVDGAAYANTRRFLRDGTLPPADAVRIEEFINYFQYDYPKLANEHPVDIHTEMSSCPWNEDNFLLKIGLKADEIEMEEISRQNLVFLIDVSGSMSDPNKLPLVKRSLKMLVNELNDEDKISIVVYAGASGLALPPTKVKDQDKIFAALENLNAGGSTAGGAGIELAYKKGQEHFVKNGNNRVILCTDGDFNVGITNRDELIKLIEKKRESGIFLSIMGFGTGNLHDATLEQLANKGNGNYNYIDNLSEARKVFVHDLRGTLVMVAKDVKLQLEFNPAKVKSYRLIGYENRMLADKDFNDDTKDAGEVGAGHTVTALYEIVPANAQTKDDVLVDELKYSSSLKTEYPNEWMTVKLRYKLPDSDESTKIEHVVSGEPQAFEKSSKDLRFVSAVAAFGMLTRGSGHSGNAAFKDIAQWAKDAKGKDEHGYRAEFVQLVQLTDDLLVTGYSRR
ncbi:MAG: von Willebrand factor type A domain-containing protein [Schleiferiaceae bacterium]|nr:von Willebrand factor type A domain-containing protein [Schleiferiaceae bacterium]